MARLYLSTGETYREVGAGATATQVNGTNGNETVYVNAIGDAIFDASFNRGGDTIIIGGNAANYTASIVGGSSLLLTSVGGASITIPIGSTGATINFADASGRTLIRDSSGAFKLGTQTIAATGTTVVTPGVDTPGTEILLTPNQDTPTSLGSTSGNDLYIADVVQVNGLQVNTLGTGDSISAGAGFDTLQAQIYRAATFDGNGGIGVNGGSNAPIQPRLNSVEKVTLEALNTDLTTKHLPYNESIPDLDVQALVQGSVYSNNTEIYFNAKNVRGHNEIWSWQSDANLTVQDLTTIVSDGGHDNARNTSEITVGVGYTSGQDTFWDSADTKVFFDQDFLLTGKENSSRAFYFLLDEKADLQHRGTNLLDFIDVTGIVFTVSGYNNGQPIELIVPNIEAVNTHLEFVAALQPALAAAKAAGLVPADLTIEVDPTITRTTGLGDLSESSPIPAIVVKTQSAAVITPIGYSHEGAPTGSFDVFGVFQNEPPVETPLPLSVNIALEKVGRGGEGGDVVVGSMDKYHYGIDVFNVTVYGDASRPSWVDYLNSTGDGYSGIGQSGALDTINIVSNNLVSNAPGGGGFPSSTTYAALTIGSTNDGLSLIDATLFKGDLTLGVVDAIQDLKTLQATGGGDVTFIGSIYTPDQYLYQTGAGKDTIDLYIEGDSLEYATSGLLIDTGAGDDNVTVGYNWGDNRTLREHAVFTLNTLPAQANLPVGEGTVTITIPNLFGTGGNFSTTLTPASTDVLGGTLDNEAEAVAVIASRINSTPASLYYAYASGNVLTLEAKNYGNNYTNVGPISIVHDNAGDITDLSTYISGGASYDSYGSSAYEADFPNHVILQNASIKTGEGADTVTTYGDGRFYVDTGAGNDVIYSEQSGSEATWVFNVDRAAYTTGSTQLDGLPGVPARYSLLAGSKVTVVFSGAGNAGSGAGGGVDQFFGNNGGGLDGNAINLKNGFEASATISLAAGKFYGTQADINKAIIAAIESSPVLSKLLTAEVGANNTLIVRTLADGGYVTQDLDIIVSRPNNYGVASNSGYGQTSTAAISNDLINDAVARNVIAQNDVQYGTTWASLYSSAPAIYAKLTGALLDNGFYSGIHNGAGDGTGENVGTAFNNLYYSGYAGYNEADHIHTPGSGDDIVVLSTNNYSSNFVPDTLPVGTIVDSNVYATLDGWLYDTASNETIVLSGDYFGKDTIVNFTTAGVGDHDPIAGQGGSANTSYVSPASGFDFLDFTSYLTSKFILPNSSNGIAPAPIPVTLQDVSGGDAPVAAPTNGATASDGITNSELDANEVFVLSIANGSGANAGENWTDLTATKLAEVINNSASNNGGHGNLLNGSLDVRFNYVDTATNHELVGGAAKAVVLVQNSANLGEYKVFEVSWNGLLTASSHTATVTERGVLDFGTSLEGLDQLNLVGSVEYSHFNFDSSYLIG